jgi:molybdopterin synthase sulfur carrier subunit
MQVTINFYSYFKDLAGCDRATETVSPGTTLAELFDRVCARFPRLVPMRRSTLMAVGLEYREMNWVLRDGDEVALFPPVQGG